MNILSRGTPRGFTIVELIVVIAVIGILAGVAVMGYSGWTARTATNTLKNELTQAQNAMKQVRNFKGIYPSTLAQLSESFKSSPDVTLSLRTDGANLPIYSNITPVQNGVLFHTICQDLISEGYGVGTNNAGQSEQYIQACNVYNNNQLQINNSWTPRELYTPVQANALPDIVNSINYNDSWRPGRDQVEKQFYSTWHERYTTQGGTYPINTFWDGTWCSTGSTHCTPRQELPTPSSTTQGATNYCIEAKSTRVSSIVMSIRPNTNPSNTSC